MPKMWDREKAYDKGAVVIYAGWAYEATRDTQPGEEPFVDRGDAWRCTNFDEVNERIAAIKGGGG